MTKLTTAEIQSLIGIWGVGGAFSPKLNEGK